MIEYPTHRSEFEIHAWLFCNLRKAGIDARGEVKATGVGDGRGCRFDLVLFEDEIALRIVEVKGYPKKPFYVLDQLSSRGDIRLPKYQYERFGVPVDKVFGGEHQAYLNWVVEHWRNPNKSWYSVKSEAHSES